jgi:hypothetical protein
MVNWGVAVPIVVAIIGISGVIIPVFSTPIINQIYNKPNIDIGIPSELENGKQIIILSNIGAMPATNLSIILTANYKIINSITNLFSTVDVTLVTPEPPSLLRINDLKQVDGPFVKLHVKSFVNGGGSIIKLGVGANTTYKDYTVYVTYDQGSNKRNGGEQGSFLLYQNPISFVVYPSIAFGIVFLYSAVRVRTQIRKRLCDVILYDLSYFRKSFRRDPTFRETIVIFPLRGEAPQDSHWKEFLNLDKGAGRFINRSIINFWSRGGKTGTSNSWT